MPPEFSSLLPLMSIFITICAVIGGAIAFGGNRGKGASEIQQSTIMAQQAQLDTQDKQIKALKEKVQRLEAIFSTLQVTLKKRRGLLIEINDDLITLVDQRTGTEQSVKIHIDSGELDVIDIKEKAP